MGCVVSSSQGAGPCRIVLESRDGGDPPAGRRNKCQAKPLLHRSLIAGRQRIIVKHSQSKGFLQPRQEEVICLKRMSSSLCSKVEGKARARLMSSRISAERFASHRLEEERGWYNCYYDIQVSSVQVSQR